MAEVKKQVKKVKDVKVTEKVVTPTPKVAEKDTKEVIAKAGKRSAKALAETEEKIAKEERKATGDTEAEQKPAKPIKPSRTRLERRGKKFREAAKLVEKRKEYSLKDAITLAQKTSTTKFDATVELHVSLAVDPKHADQNIRGMVSLPAGSGKTLRVAVFADTDDVKKAKAAGADVAGSDEFLQQLDKEEINFDVLIATPTMMAKLGKYARILGPKGLMPNPKSGTVTADVAKAVKEAKAGKIEYRVDSAGIVHVGTGKVSFSANDLQSNIQAIMQSIRASKPASVKATYVESIYLTTSMGPSVRVNSNEL